MPVPLQCTARSLLALTLLSFTATPSHAASEEPVAADFDPSPAEILDQPDQIAWEYFIEVNRPQDLGKDLLVWETWPNTDAVFADPTTVPRWPAAPPPRLLEEENVKAKHFVDELQRISVAGKMVELHQDSEKRGMWTEIRMNKPALDWIADFNMYYIDLGASSGQTWAFERWQEGKPVEIQFPKGSIFIKAAWGPIEQQKAAKYLVREHDGKLLGMTAMHIAAKILRNWLWATWEHVDNPERVEAFNSDSYGTLEGALSGPERGHETVSESLLDQFQKHGMDPKMWQNYRLNGTQVDYVDRLGQPIVLGNSIIELGFHHRSSCMTCHSRSSIGEDGARLDHSPIFGAPEPDWFVIPSSRERRVYLPLDFIWSLARAKARPVSP